MAADANDAAAAVRAYEADDCCPDALNGLGALAEAAGEARAAALYGRAAIIRSAAGRANYACCLRAGI
jgi:hypothetical protein